MSKAEGILKNFRMSDETDDSVSSRLDDILEAMKEIASLAWDAGKINTIKNTKLIQVDSVQKDFTMNHSYIDKEKEQFINNLFNQ